MGKNIYLFIYSVALPDPYKYTHLNLHFLKSKTENKKQQKEK